MPDGLYHGDHGDHGFLLTGSLVAVADHLDAGEGAHAVVHAYHALCIVWHEGQTVLHGVEACLSAVGELVGHAEVILLAELSPVGLLGFWQHEDDLQVSRIGPEALQRPHQHGPAPNGQKLFGNITPHPQALPACHNDYIIHSLPYFMQRTIRTESGYSLTVCACSLCLLRN